MPVYNQRAAKKASHLSINSDLLQKARELKINLSATLEQALVEQIQQEQRKRWLAENQEAIEAYNREVLENGVWSEQHQGWRKR